MPLKIEELKSAEVIEDPIRIASILEERIHKQRATVGASLHTRLSKGDDGPSKIEKQTGAICTKAHSPEVPKGEALKKLFKGRGIAFEEGFEKRIVPYWASDERVDAHGDIVKANWIFDEFNVNSVLPFSHRWGDLPVGNSLMEKVADRKDGKGKQKYDGKALWLLAFFASEEQSEFADSVFRLVKGGLLKSGSVGFWSAKLIDVKDEDEREELGLGRWGVILDKNHLLEFSPVLLPANSGAFSLLSQAKQKELLVPEDFRTIRELYRQELYSANADNCKEQWEELDSNLKIMSKTLFDDAEWIEHKELDVPLIEYKSTTEIETEDESGEEGKTVIEIVLPKDAFPIKADDAVMEHLEAKLDRTQALLEEALISQGKVLEDIREGIEQINSALELSDDDGEPDDSQGTSLNKLLRLCDENQKAAN